MTTEHNWVGIHESYKWFAVDANGQAFVFTEKPALGDAYWGSMSMFPKPLRIHPDPFCVDWKSSLQQRPSKQAAQECVVPVAADKVYTKEQLRAYFLHVGLSIYIDDIDWFITNVLDKKAKEEREAVKFLTELGYSVEKQNA